MQKQLRIITSRRLAVCSFSSGYFSPPPLPRSVSSRHFRRHPVALRLYGGVISYKLTAIWYVWCFPNGRRMLSAMPF
jgi:hypothetical protein